MAKYRNALPQLGGGLFLTDGGIETTLIFHEGLTLPYFAAFDLLKTADGEAALRKYFDTYATLARAIRRRLHPRERDLARQPRLGDQARLFRRRARRRQPAGDRAAARASRPARVAREPDGGERLHRPARRRLQPGVVHGRSRGRGLSRPAGADVPRRRRRPGDRHHHDLRSGGDRHHACGPLGRHAGRDLLHGGDRRQIAGRADRSATPSSRSIARPTTRPRTT